MMVAMSVSLLFTGCDSDDSVSSPIRHKITFTAPVISGITRNLPEFEQNTPYSKNETFRVFGFKYSNLSLGDNLLPFEPEYSPNGEEAKYKAEYNGWDTDITHYWEPSKKYAFRAYSPANIPGAKYDETDATKCLSIIDYTMPNIGEQYDIMFAETSCDIVSPTPKRPENNNAHYDGVNMKFRHALSSVHFKVCINPSYLSGMKDAAKAKEAARFKIQQIIVYDVMNKGSFYEGAVLKKVDKGSFVGLEYNKVENPRWDTDINSKANYDFLNSEIAQIPYEGAKDVKVIDNANHFAFMIPQQLSPDARIVIKWTYEGDLIDHPIEYGTRTLYLNNSSRNNVISDKWEIGKRYIYTLALTKDNIYVTPSVDDFIDNPEIIVE